MHALVSLCCIVVTRTQYDYDLMAKLTGNTNGSLRKMWPPIKKKAIEAYPSFATFISNTSDKITAASGEAKAAPKAAAGRKRKVADAEVEADSDSKDVEPKFTGTKSNKTDSAGTKSDGKAETKKKAPPAKKGRATKKPKAEVRDEEDSANGGDGLGQYAFTQKTVDWLNSTDGCLGTKEIEDEA
jgi:hypothetical protein